MRGTDSQASPAAARELSRRFAAALLEGLPLASYRPTAMSVGAYLWHAGSEVRALPFVESGSLHAVVRPGSAGNAVIPIAFEHGELAALSRLFGAGAVPFDLLVKEAGRCRWIPLATIEERVMQRSELLALLVPLLTSRLRQAQERERIWLERGVQERVRATLMRLIDEQDHQGDIAWRLPATHEQLAMQCGISRAKLSHELKALEQVGAVSLHRGAISIVNPGLILVS